MVKTVEAEEEQGSPEDAGVDADAT